VDWECCWHRKEIAADECISIVKGEEALLTSQRRRIVEKCLECPRFKADMEQAAADGNPLASLVPHVAAEYFEQKGQLQSVAGFLSTKTREISFLHELSLVLQTSMDLDEVLSVALTAITAGKGFGMNRAFLLMVDKDRTYLRGYLGVGPRNAEEAWHTWQEINLTNLTLREMASHFLRNKLSSEKMKFQDVLNRLTVHLSNERNIFVRAMRERKALLIENAFQNPAVDPEIAETLGVDSFLLMPLISGNRRIGLIIADNCITHKPITQQDMQSMETFAFPVAFALVRASLYERLQEEVQKLTYANTKLREQQELIVKMEKMALVGKITSSIAHSIRNPLLVIGGFARSLLKYTAPDDPKKESLESIVNEAKQLERVLEEVLNYSDSLYPVKDWWDMVQLAEYVVQELAGAMKQRGITLTFAPDVQLPRAYVDYKHTSYCIKTVMNTAMGRLGDGGEIRIDLRLMGDWIAFAIADNGPVMSDAEREAMLTPFSATQQLGGGLGMPLCRAMLEKQGCAMEIENPPDGGAVFIIHLPTIQEV
jgi:hypothetical protein